MEELHGLFQFSKDCFKDTFKKSFEGKAALAVEYKAVKVCEQWYAQSDSISGFDQTQLDFFQSTFLYSQGQYEECIALSKSVLSRLDKHNHLERELLETIGRCACKVNDKDVALHSILELDMHHKVEEPGLFAFKSYTYFHFGLTTEGIKSGDEYLRLRPGDISMHLLIADACKHVDNATAIKHYEHAKQCLSSHRRSEKVVCDDILKKITKILSDLQPG